MVHSMNAIATVTCRSACWRGDSEGRCWSAGGLAAVLDGVCKRLKIINEPYQNGGDRAVQVYRHRTWSSRVSKQNEIERKNTYRETGCQKNDSVCPIGAAVLVCS